MKKIIFFILIFLFQNLLLFSSSKVNYNPYSKTLSMTDVYIKNHPEANCYNVVLKIVPDKRYPYNVALQIDLKNTYDTSKKCEHGEDNAFYDPISSNLIIPEFNINNKLYAINLRFDTKNMLFYIKGIVPLSSEQKKEELLGYCYYNKDEIHEFCWEFYYVPGVRDKNSVIETAKKGCIGMKSTLMENQHCPIYNDFTYKCKSYLDEGFILVSYDKEYDVQNNFLPYKEEVKKACEMYYNGEFYSNY